MSFLRCFSASARLAYKYGQGKNTVPEGFELFQLSRVSVPSLLDVGAVGNKRKRGDPHSISVLCQVPDNSFCLSLLCNFRINGLIDYVQAGSINTRTDIRHTSTVSSKEGGSKPIHNPNIIFWLLLNRYSIDPTRGMSFLLGSFYT